MIKLTHVVAAAAMLAATQAPAADVTLRIGAGHPPVGFAYVQAADSYFIPEVTRLAASKGHNVRFIKAWAGTVAKVDGVIEAVEKGVLDIGLSNPSFEPSRAPLLNISFYAPFVSPDPQLMQKVAMRLLKEAPGLQDSMRPYGIHILQLSTLENYGVLSNYSIKALGDLRGRKIGVAGANSTLYAAAGSVPVTMPAPEAYTSIKNGLIDGQVFFASGFESFKLNEVAKHFVRTGQGSYVGSAMLMNISTRSKLPSDLVQVIDQVAEATSRRIAEINVERESTAEVKAKVSGVTVSELPRSDLAKWMASIREAPQNHARELDAKGLKGTDTFAAYFRLIKDAGYQMPVTYSGF
ncbi:MAG: TRAP transporter substrate-binding protein DctP [Pseudomonadota bacterium]